MYLLDIGTLDRDSSRNFWRGLHFIKYISTFKLETKIGPTTLDAYCHLFKAQH